MSVAPLRVLHCPSAIGGHPQGLAAAERAVGLQSLAVCFVPHPLGIPSDEVLAPVGTPVWRAEIARWRLLWRAIRDFDVIHFNFGRTIAPSLDSMERARESGSRVLASAYAAYAGLLEFRDLPLLRRAGKVIAVTFQGDDARQGDYCAEHFDVHATAEVEAGYYSPSHDERRRRVIAHFDRYADLIYAVNPDLLHVLPERARFVPYAHINPSTIEPARGTPEPSERPVIVHAPTHRGVKGTRYLLQAVDRLKAEGHAFDLRLVEGVSREEAMRLYRDADLLVDQLLLGWYGGVAVELMAMGKPVVCFIRDSDLTKIPSAMRDQLPVDSATPETVYAVLSKWLNRPGKEWLELGRQSQSFVERWHDPCRIAAEMATDYQSCQLQRGD